ENSKRRRSRAANNRRRKNLEFRRCGTAVETGQTGYREIDVRVKAILRDDVQSVGVEGASPYCKHLGINRTSEVSGCGKGLKRETYPAIHRAKQAEFAAAGEVGNRIGDKVGVR